jgi:hypothetical protein
MVWYANAQGRYGASGAKGDRGELIVEEYCLTNNIKCIPKKDIISQTKLKIDYIINEIPIDVKTNYYKGMLAVECYTKKSGAGWIFTTTAEQIYGVDIDSKSIFRYNVKDMLEYVVSNKTKAKKTRNFDILLWVPSNLSFIEKLQ